MRIDIIGAGPAGCYAGYLLAKKGHSVNIYEKKTEIGLPIQCTGILSDSFSDILDPKEEFVLNPVEKTRIYAPNGKFVDAPIKKNYVICRKSFDRYLAKQAKKAGVKIFTEHSFVSMERKGKAIISKIDAKGKLISSEADFLVGADGPLSTVAKSAGLFGERKFLIGSQVEAKLKNDNAVEFYPYMGSYAWIVPVDKETVRIGVASYKKSGLLFKGFAEKKLGKDFKKKIISYQSGIIPVFNPKIKAMDRNIYLIGDAATFVKATSGGGINQGLKAAKILSETIGKDYQRAWKKDMYTNLYLHLILHEMMSKFSEKDWNSLISDFSAEKMRKILYEESRDNLLKMFIKIASAKPSLFRYVNYFPFCELRNLRL